jgi:hypothetical protein
MQLKLIQYIEEVGRGGGLVGLVVEPGDHRLCIQLMTKLRLTAHWALVSTDARTTWNADSYYYKIVAANAPAAEGIAQRMRGETGHLG